VPQLLLGQPFQDRGILPLGQPGEPPVHVVLGDFVPLEDQ